MFDPFIADLVPLYSDSRQTLGYSTPAPASTAPGCLPITSPDVAANLASAAGWHQVAENLEAQPQLAKLAEQIAMGFSVAAATFGARDRSLAEVAANTPAAPNDANMGTIDVGGATGGGAFDGRTLAGG